MSPLSVERSLFGMSALTGLVCVIWLFSMMPLPGSPEELTADWRFGGDVRLEKGRALFEKGREAFVEIPLPGNATQTLGLDFALTGGTALFSLIGNDQEIARFALRKDKSGESLTLQSFRLDPETDKWAISKSEPLTYQPAQKATFAWDNLRRSGLDPQGWQERAIELRIVRSGDDGDDRIGVYAEGVLALVAPTPGDAKFRIQLPPGDGLTAISRSSWSGTSRFQPASLQDIVPGDAPEKFIEKDGIPFLRAGGGGIDLRKAEWPFARDLPSNYFAAYDSGPMFLRDPRVPTLWVPAQDYSSLRLLARRTKDAADFGDRFSVRVGSFGQGALGGRGQVLQLDYHGRIPKKDGEQILTIPLTEAIAQDLGNAVQIQFNKEIRLARRSPDPSRFEFRPLGLPPGMEILAATLEIAPIQMRLTSSEPGHVFEGREAHFVVHLKNTTSEKRDFQIAARAQNPDGGTISQRLTGSLDAGETREMPLRFEGPAFGYYDLTVTLNEDSLPLRRRTSFALLPPDTRKRRAESPFGTWTYVTPSSPDTLGSLLKRAGLRFGMGQFPKDRARWGIQNNFEPKAIQDAKKYEDWLEKNPDTLPTALLMHEHSISEDHVTRVPDAISGRKPYQLSPDEKRRFQALWDDQVAMAKLMRERFPHVHLRLGNGPLPTKEEFLRAGFPAGLFDSLGNESGSFGRPPEAQPPDWIGNNSGLWMDHQLLKAYGYDKPVTQCYEIMYPSTNPGNLAPLDQAAYLARHAMHSLVWGIPEIRFGLLEDVVSAYRFSNWGASGLVHAPPEDNPKPSYVAVATMTRLLDGARFERVLETGSASVYGVEFSVPDGHTVAALWTLRGEREISVAVSGDAWQRTDWQGNSHPIEPEQGWASLTLSPMPLYLSGKGELGNIRLGAIRHPEKPAPTAMVISKLDDLSAWEAESQPDPILENHNPLTPRRPGQFDYAEDGAALRVHAAMTEGPEAIPLYGGLTAKTPIPLPGLPTDLGIWIEGNSGWGRVIYELQDAKGQKWTSIGASRKGEISEWMLDWLPAEFAKSKGQTATQADWNTNDVFGLSAINFDGWRYARFPLPGNYPGEKTPWPANSQWRSDGDGIVEYPLQLTRLIFEMPTHILKLNKFFPVENPTIRVRDLTVESNNPGASKQGIHEDEN